MPHFNYVTFDKHNCHTGNEKSPDAGHLPVIPSKRQRYCSLPNFCSYGYQGSLYGRFGYHSQYYPQGFPQLLLNHPEQVEFVIFSRTCNKAVTKGS